MVRSRSYREMAIDAIKSYNDRTGTSREAIANYIIAQQGHDTTFNKRHLNAALKKGVEAGVFITVKNSYKLATQVRYLIRAERQCATSRSALHNA
tara:strand:+ start:5589 stop:5873 length:285 start_codon:yes stop_codon:yes gene_type:complete